MKSKNNFLSTLLIACLTIFLASCSQNLSDSDNLVVEGEVTLSEEERANFERIAEEASAYGDLIDKIASNESFKAFHENLVSNDEDEAASNFNEYVHVTLVSEYPELANMEVDVREAIYIYAYQEIEFELESRRLCHCTSGCHFCCIASRVGGLNRGTCFWLYCHNVSGVRCS